MSQDEPKSRKLVISKTQELINRSGQTVKPVTLTSDDFHSWLDRKAALLIFFLLAILGGALASWTGLAQPKIALDLISEHPIIGVVIYLSIMIPIIERVAETYRLNFRSAAKERKAEQLKYYLDHYQGSDKEERITSKMKSLKIHTISTQRRMLQITFTTGFILSSIGALRLIPYFTNNEYPGSLWMSVTIDTADILLCSVLVAGGSKGWNTVSKGILDFFTKRP
ncbi:hypothetical protein [Agarivorans sp. DSG3-1]|uniref:hypothetical protein n=1 Tax=Agarivorans sp. DSG3-1 TaxID=3342249 RepID=UPI00398F7495